ncbi:saccharopine dehydrogenase family protein [Rhodococcus sp. BP22]|uniref:saccharopine dehydrogenase family protein n=1 Tax=Rhodococcus sp. BP22 TaxID=2758566 RepID=UPI00164805D3|nr:saccharopine dehydrogenase NADP-binding domain-containing protein [Rhodococcus sp. BP22]
MKVVILSAGTVGGEVARELAKSGVVDEMVVADRDESLAVEVVADVQSESMTAVAAGFDAADTASIDAVIAGADIVFNAVGPFYRFGMNIVHAAVAARAHYVDVCDEFDVTQKLINNSELDEEARAADLTVLTGMGSSPGVTNLAARWAVDELTSAHTVNVVIGVPYRVDLGYTLNDHMLHSMSGNVSQYLDGAERDVPAWASPQTFTMTEPFGTHDFGYMGHPEGVTLGRFIAGLRNAVVRFAWFEPEGVQIWKDLDRLGMLSGKVPDGLPISPREFLARYMTTPEGQQHLGIEVTGQLPGSAWQVAVDGEKDGVPTRIAIEGHILYPSSRNSAGTITAVPAAAALVELIEGRLTRRGIVAPEACIEDAEGFVRRVTAASEVGLHHTVTVTS